MIMRTLLLSCVLLLSACTNRLTSPLDIKHKQHIQNIDAYIEQPQSQNYHRSRKIKYACSFWTMDWNCL